MDDVLIVLDTDLASDITIRYACMLEKRLRFKVQVIHVPDTDEKGHTHGNGWVYQKWNNAIVQKAGEEITSLVQKPFYHISIGEPKIIPGERDQVILEEIKQPHYGLLMEGLLYSFEPNLFFQKLDSILYKNLPYPVLMVKNLVDIERGIQIVGTSKTIASVLSWFFALFNEFPESPDILICDFETAIEKVVMLENDPGMISDIDDLFLKQGKKTGNIRTAKGSPNELSLLVRDHALSMCHMPKAYENMSITLSLSPCPVMFCPEFKTA